MREDGFSLVEVLIASVVTLMVAGALYSSLDSTQTFYENYSASMDQRQTARVALDRMTDELRLAGYDVGTVPEVLSMADDQVIQFVGDVDDGDPAGPCGAAFEDAAGGGAERITYQLDTQKGQLVRTVDCWDGASWTNNAEVTVVLDNVDPNQVLFRYYDLTGTQIPLGGGPLDQGARSDVRSVRIDLQLTDPKRQVVGKEYLTLKLEAEARLYNFETRADA